MQRLWITGLVCSAAVLGQAIVDPSRSAQIASRFDPKPADRSVVCAVEPVKPLLGFGFRFRAGYVFEVSLEQDGEGRHRWNVWTEITPDSGNPVYLVDLLRLPPAPKTKISGEAGGGYLLGEGHYRVRWVLIDDLGRVCRKRWEVEVKRHRGESGAKIAMAPNSVAELSLRGLPAADRHPDPGRPIRLAVLVDAAPLVQRRLIRNKLSANDHVFLISAVSALLERIPTSSVRVVVFNLEHQQELFRRDDFTLDSLGEMSRALNDLRLGTVSAKILQNQTGHVDFLAGLINQELQSVNAADAVVFLGPRERFEDKVPAELIDPGHTQAPLFFFLRYRAVTPARAQFVADPCDRMPSADAPIDPEKGGRRAGNSPCSAAIPTINPMADGTFSNDTVSLAVKILKGKTITIQSPGEFARAIEQVERRVGIGEVAQPNPLASEPR
jgi:hypothetical protein